MTFNKLTSNGPIDCLPAVNRKTYALQILLVHATTPQSIKPILRIAPISSHPIQGWVGPMVGVKKILSRKYIYI